MKQSGFIFLGLIILLSSCTSAQQTSQSEATETASPSKTPGATNTYTPEPTATNTPTLAPTPMGGTTLRVAYFSHDCEAINTKNCIAIGDFFAETVLDRIPLSDATMETNISWSPDGRYLMYQNTNDNQVNFDVMLYDFVLTQSTILKSYLIEMPIHQVYYKGELVNAKYTYDNRFSSSDWSADSQYVVYRTSADYVNNQINIYAVESEQNKVLTGFTDSYYWLDDQRSLIEIKTGKLYDVETDELTTIPNAYFMNGNTWFEEYFVSLKGEDPSKTDEIYFYPYVRDRGLLIENGTSIIYDGEFLFAKFDYENKKRMPSFNIRSFFILGEKVMFSGFIYLLEPYEVRQYEYIGNLSDVPFMITSENFNDLTMYDYSQIISISPDAKLYLTQQVFPLENSKIRQSFITVNDIETREELDIFDFHTLSKEMHEIDYTDGNNMAIYWEIE